MPDVKYISIPDLCTYFGVARATVDRWRKAGLPFIKVGRQVRFDKDIAIDWVLKNTDTSNGSNGK
ncbi:MAG: helix-turn-helix domain-containing protein [Firmicutes bacterium]|nr:helix-turn-helix domain-containing protein [Bacillota bacterium]